MFKIFNYFLLFSITFLFNGCLLTIGQPKGLCEGENCNYKTAGVCDDVISIYKNRHTLKNYQVTKRWYMNDEIKEK